MRLAFLIGLTAIVLIGRAEAAQMQCAQWTNDGFGHLVCTRWIRCMEYVCF